MSSSNIINLAERRAQREAKEQMRSVSGWIVWLHCPSCKTLEYTEVRMDGGRIHKCGNMVEEKEVAIDIRAEYTISCRNLELLNQFKSTSKLASVLSLFSKNIDQFILQLKHTEQEYQNRLQIMMDSVLTAYPDDWKAEDYDPDLELLKPLGVQISAARQGQKYFPEHT